MSADESGCGKKKYAEGLNGNNLSDSVMIVSDPPLGFSICIDKIPWTRYRHGDARGRSMRTRDSCSLSLISPLWILHSVYVRCPLGAAAVSAVVWGGGGWGRPLAAGKILKDDADRGIIHTRIMCRVAASARDEL